MSNKTLLKIANISGWLLLVLLILYFISGYAMVHKYGMDSLMNNSQAGSWHKHLAMPFFILLFLHITPYYIVRKQVKRLLIILVIVFTLPVLGVLAINKFQKPEVKPPVRSEQKEAKTIKCPNCPRECDIPPGETGECEKYRNIDGKLYPEGKGIKNE